MKILFIGGTGRISMAISRRLIEKGEDLYLLNRGNRSSEISGVSEIQADIHNEDDVSRKLNGLTFDAVADFIAYNPADLERDYRLFRGKTRQFIYISSASAYQKPLQNNLINESTPLINPYWDYSRNKIAGENFLMEKYRTENFPITIVRPSHTYDERGVPVGLHGKNGSWQVLKRMIDGKRIIIPGDGTAFWTMTHNSDFAVGFIGLLGNPHAIGQAVQIMSTESMTWNQIYQTIADDLNVKLNSVHISSEFLGLAGLQYDFRGQLLGDKANSVNFDISKLQSLVPEFLPKISMTAGIGKSVAYVLDHPECQIADPDFDKWCDHVLTVRDQAVASL